MIACAESAPTKTLGFVKYLTKKKSILTTINYILRVYRHVFMCLNMTAKKLLKTQFKKSYMNDFSKHFVYMFIKHGKNWVKTAKLVIVTFSNAFQVS